MEDSIFTKIIKGEVPCHKVYEDEKTLAFMDIHPIQPGMVLVVSKAQVDHFMDLQDDDYMALMRTVQKVARKIREVFPGRRAGVIIEGFDVPHTHVKVVPIASGDELRTGQDMESEPDHEMLADMASMLRI